MRTARPLTARRGGSSPWWSRFAELYRFEFGARAIYAGFKVDKSGAALTYSIDMPVPHYDSRQVTIRFSSVSPYVPHVTVDGLPPHHTYGENTLCMWHPFDPKSERWVLQDGLLQLLGITQRHLFKEAWFREHGEWLGEEAPHDLPAEEKAAE